MKRIILVILACLFSLTVHAEINERKNNYIGLEGGFYIPQGDADYGTSYYLKTGTDFGLKYTHYIFNKYLGVTFRASYIVLESEKKTTAGQQEYFEFETVNFSPGLAFRYPVNRFDLLLEVGPSYNISKVRDIFESGGNTTKGEAIGTAFGMYAEGGARFYFTENITAGALVRYSYNNQQTRGRLREIDLNGLSLLLTLGMAFDLHDRAYDGEKIVYRDKVVYRDREAIKEVPAVRKVEKAAEKPKEEVKPAKQAKPVKQAKPADTRYVVRRGDTLRSIADKYYGNPEYWPLIAWANQSVVANAYRIYPGQRLTIRLNPTQNEIKKALDYSEQDKEKRIEESKKR